MVVIQTRYSRANLIYTLDHTKAMQYFREKYQNVAFVVASDDRQWITQMFKNMSDVHLTPRYQTMKRGEYDMAILAQCNHSIIRFVQIIMIIYEFLCSLLIL